MMQKVYTKIESIVGNVVTVRASGVRNGDLALVGDSYANVIKLDKDLVTLQVFSGTQGVSTTDPVRFLGRPMMVSFSDHLLGRIFDGAGVPRDNGPALTENMIPIGGPSVNPSKRIVPDKMIRTGIPMIDVFNTLVESQKLPIFSVSGEPYNQLLSRIAMQAQVDIIVLGGMGLKYDDYLFFRDTLEKSGAMGRTVMFIHTASDPTVECTLVPDMALAVAEQFALAGKRVLVLGSGGAASAVSRALRRSGAALTICCRHPEKTAGWNMETRLWRELPLLAADCDLLVNATPLGMTGQEEFADFRFLENCHGWVYDLVYQPRETALLAAAQDRGLPVIGGLALLHAQAELAFELFVGE